MGEDTWSPLAKSSSQRTGTWPPPPPHWWKSSHLLLALLCSPPVHLTCREQSANTSPTGCPPHWGSSSASLHIWVHQFLSMMYLYFFSQSPLSTPPLTELLLEEPTHFCPSPSDKATWPWLQMWRHLPTYGPNKMFTHVHPGSPSQAMRCWKLSLVITIGLGIFLAMIISEKYILYPNAVHVTHTPKMKFSQNHSLTYVWCMPI